MLTQDRWLLPEGIEEIFPDEAEHLDQLGRLLIDQFHAWGYRLVMPPMVDFLDSLLTGSGYELDQQTLKFVDPLTGRLVGLRADMTPQVARIDARTVDFSVMSAQPSDSPLPVLSYLGPTSAGIITGNGALGLPSTSSISGKGSFSANLKVRTSVASSDAVAVSSILPRASRAPWAEA